ncbi:MAG: FecR domain-containing protein [Deltaproteobacteria bacterium]|nr:FecR domain-containing protein [Deltaproteobacteria bacterium]
MTANDDRGSLRSLAEPLEALDPAARDRVLARVRGEGPRVVKRARFVRTASRVGGAAAALILVVVGLTSGGERTYEVSGPVAVVAPSRDVVAPKAEELKAPAPRSKAPEVVPSRAPARAAVAAGDARACERWEGARGRFELTGGRLVLELGRRGRAVAASGARVALEGSGPCDTVIRLDSGTVAVRADDLGRGALRVVTREGEVRVHGTMFSVSRAERRLIVEVAEGRVEVTPTGRQSAFVAQGERLAVEARGPRRSSLDPRRRNELVAMLSREAPAPVTERIARVGPAPSKAVEPKEGDEPEGPPPVVDAPPPSPIELVARAERLRKIGELREARTIFRAVGSGSGELAEAALLRLADLELEDDAPAEAQAVAKQLLERFPNGRLAVEAAWISVRAAEARGARREARELATRLIARWPSTPYADSARSFLAKTSAP